VVRPDKARLLQASASVGQPPHHDFAARVGDADALGRRYGIRQVFIFSCNFLGALGAVSEVKLVLPSAEPGKSRRRMDRELHKRVTPASLVVGSVPLM
jgi:hypothetical protein